MNQLQMNAQAIESTDGHLLESDLMNTMNSNTVNVGQDSILPAYTMDGILTWDIEHGSFTTDRFENFIEHTLIPFCMPYPGPRSIIVMDNAPVHRSEACQNHCIEITCRVGIEPSLASLPS